MSFTKSEIHALISQAKDLVSDEDEPYRTAAFQVILDHLISGKAEPEPASKITEPVEEDTPQVPAKIALKEDLVNFVSGLGDSDKIPILWSFSDREWMKVDEFLAAAAEAGISIARSWSPKQGGNFNNRLFKERKLFVKKGEGKEAMYKLSAEGKQKVKELLTRATN